MAWQEEDEKRAAKALESLIEDFSNPEIADSLEKAFRHLGGHVEGEQALQEGFKAAKAAEKEEAVRFKSWHLQGFCADAHRIMNWELGKQRVGRT